MGQTTPAPPEPVYCVWRYFSASKVPGPVVWFTMTAVEIGKPEGERLREGRPGARSCVPEAQGPVGACGAPARSPARRAGGRGRDAPAGAERGPARRGRAAAGDDHASGRGRRHRQSGVTRSCSTTTTPASEDWGARRARRGSGYARVAVQHAWSHAISSGARISPSTRPSPPGARRPSRRPHPGGAPPASRDRT